MPRSFDREDLRRRVAAHIGAAEVCADGRMRCPSCGGTDFGPTRSLEALAVYEEGYLPGAPILAGVCMGCEHTTAPRTPAAGLALHYYQPGDGAKLAVITQGDGWLPGARCPGCGAETLYAVLAMRLSTVGLAGVMPKFGGEGGVQLLCRAPGCAVEPSAVVTPAHPRSY